uniref:Uncharacterized protein n=1 Tax=Peronospora matthiolae TaxID=2874970 RepID=A0AAV1VHG5_9STRA
MLLGAPVSWGSKKQPSVSLSTTEAEYIALSLAIQEGKWIHHLLCEIVMAANEEGPELIVIGHRFPTSIGNRDRSNPNRLFSLVFTT